MTGVKSDIAAHGYREMVLGGDAIEEQGLILPSHPHDMEKSAEKEKVSGSGLEARACCGEWQ